MHRRGGRPSPEASRGGRGASPTGPWILWLLLPLHLAAVICAQSWSGKLSGPRSSTTDSAPLGARGAPLRRQRHLPPTHQQQAIFHIGAVVNPPDSTSYFAQAIEDAVAEHGITLYAQTVHMNSNPIRIAQSVCENLISSQVFAVVISHPVLGELSPAAVSYTCGFYNVPVIGISSRHSSLSDKNVSWVQTFPTFITQTKVADSLGCRLKALCTIFRGRELLHRLGTLSLLKYIDACPSTDTPNLVILSTPVELHVWYRSADGFAAGTGPGIERVSVLPRRLPRALYLINAFQIRFVRFPEPWFGFDMQRHLVQNSHNSGRYQGRSLIEPDLELKHPSALLNPSCSPDGAAGIQMALATIKRSALHSQCNVSSLVTQQTLAPLIVRSMYFQCPQWSMSMELDLELDRMVWPGNQTETPLGYVIPKHLKVATIAERPFVWVRPVADEGDCLPSEIPCPWTNSSDGIAYSFCCEGYCMDLLQSLSQKLNFTYTLYQVQDGQYGTFDFVNGSTHKRWSGMVGDLVRGVADMIIAPLTITPERSMEIEFTKPFKYQGITILAKKASPSSTLASFLQPFQKTLWILVMVSVHVVALALYLLDRFSPFGRYKLPNSDATEEDALNLSSAIWFAWGVLLNSGIAEGTPRSFSGRVLGMVWAGFAMIVVASYTANLAAFLVLEKPESSLSGINDPRLRNPSENFTYATVKGSAVDMYFRRQVELSNMYRIMEGKNYDSVEEGIEALKNNQLDAFIWDSSRLEFEAAQHCELVTAGEQFGRSGYGIGLQRNSFWVDKVTLTLLEMHESGYMEQLDSKWIIRGGEKCETKNERTPATLGLTNMAGVFILVGAGIVGGIGLIVIEIVYKKHQTRKQRRLELARHAADKWRGAVEMRQRFGTSQAGKRFRQRV
ncbi:unnamed protein product [Ixodes hexagonus]